MLQILACFAVSSKFVAYGADRAFKDLVLPSANIISAATNGVETYYVSTQGNLFYSQSLDATPVQIQSQSGLLRVEYIGVFMFLKQDGNTVLLYNPQTSIYTNVTPSLDLTSGVKYVNFTSGPISSSVSGLVLLRTDNQMDVFSYVGSQLVKQTTVSCNISGAGITYQDVYRIDLNVLPIFYLANKTALVYVGIDGAPTMGCAYGAKNNFRLFNQSVSRFFPYAGSNEQGQLTAYLQNRSVFYCIQSQAPFQKQAILGSYQDFYHFQDGNYMYITATSMTINAPISNANFNSVLTYAWKVPSATLTHALALPPNVEQTTDPSNPDTPTNVTLKSDVIGFDTASGKFADVKTPTGKVVLSVASNGAQIYFVTTDYKVYSSVNKTIEPSLVELASSQQIIQVVVGGGSFFFLQKDGKVLINNGIFTDVSSQIPESVACISGGVGGVLAKGVSAFYLLTVSNSGVLVSKISLGSSNFTAYQVHRAEMEQVPVFYLRNGSAFVYRATFSTSLTCVLPDKAGFARVNASNIKRFLPAGRELYGTPQSGYLDQNGALFECAGQTGTPSSVLPATYEDVLSNGIQMAWQKDGYVQTTTNVAGVQTALHYSLKTAGNQDTWMGIVSDFRQHGSKGEGASTLLIRGSQHVQITMPQNSTASATDGSSALYLAGKKLYYSYPMQATPVAVEVPDGVAQITFGGIYLILNKKKQLFQYSQGSLSRVQEFIGKKVYAIGGYGSNVYVATGSGFYSSGADGSFVQSDTPFASFGAVRIEANENGAVVYTRYGTAWVFGTIGSNCVKKIKGKFSEIDAYKPIRVSPGTTGFVLLKNGTIKSCQSVAQVSEMAQQSSYKDYLSAALYIDSSGTLGPQVAGETATKATRLYLSQDGAIPAGMDPYYSPVNLRLALGLGIGIPGGLLLVGIAVLIVVKCTRKPTMVVETTVYATQASSSFKARSLASSGKSVLGVSRDAAIIMQSPKTQGITDRWITGFGFSGSTLK